MLRYRWSTLSAMASFAAALGCASVRAETTPPTPASAQPSVPQSLNGGASLASPLLGGKAGAESAGDRKALTVRKKVSHLHRTRRHVARDYDEPLERPALAGVELVAPIPHPIQPPHFTVPVPAYPFENFVTFYTTPPPPVVCAHTRRDPYAPDPHLVREQAVVCEADNP